MSQTMPCLSTATPPRRFPWRRLLQYRLRTLLILTAVCAVVFAWLGWWKHQASQQREAVAALQSAGAIVLYEPRLAPGMASLKRRSHWPGWLVRWLGIDFFKNVDSVGTCRIYFTCENRINDAALKPLKYLPSLRSLCLEGSHVSDAGLVVVESLPALEDLYVGHTAITDAAMPHLLSRTSLRAFAINDTQITDRGMEQLKKLTGLERLYLRRTSITDDGLRSLQGLTTLRGLELTGTQITDDGLEIISHLVNLDTLYLEETQVTDTGLEHLRGLAALQTLKLKGTKVTGAGVARLKEALPKCDIDLN